MLKLGITENLILHLLSKDSTWMSTGQIIELLGRIKKSEPAVRATLFRLRNKKLVKDLQKGRETFFSLTNSVKEVFTDYTNRLLRSEKKWDGKWLLLSFNIPEKKRNLRNSLRQELLSLGFGRLHTNLWISPYDIREECNKVAEGLGVKEYMAMFMTDYIGDNPKVLASRVWNLEQLSGLYQQFVEKYRKQYTEFRKSHLKDSSQGALEALVKLLKLNEEIAEYRSRYPYLPKELFPDKWVGFDLIMLILEYSQFLQQKSSHLSGIDLGPPASIMKGIKK